MHGFTVFTAVSLPLVAAFIVPRATKPDSWSASLEKWTTYHARYIRLGCDENHTTDFFDKCCHPLQANQDPSDLPSQCHPGNNVVTNGGSSGGSDDDDDDNCDDVGDSPAEARPTTATSTQSAATPTTSDDGNDDDCDDEGDNTPTATPATLAPSTNVVTGGFGTYYYQNGVAGACGNVHQDTDPICALQTNDFANGQHCGKQIRVTNTENNKSVTVTVADECPTCKENSVDLGLRAFEDIAPQAEGIVPIEWNFV